MEVYAFEMETKIVSLEDELSAVLREREETLSKNDDLTSELEALSEKLNKSNLEVNALQEEVSALVSFFFLVIFTLHWFLFPTMKIHVLKFIICLLFSLFDQSQRLEESKFEQEKMENSIKMLEEEKEELAMVAYFLRTKFRFYMIVCVHVLLV